MEDCPAASLRYLVHGKVNDKCSGGPLYPNDAICVHNNNLLLLKTLVSSEVSCEIWPIGLIHGNATHCRFHNNVGV